MAILVIFTGRGVTKEKYEALRKEIGWESDHPTGGIFHVVGFDSAGDAHVADVWESQEAMDAFVGNHLMPAMKKLNIPPPKVDVYPVHNISTYESVDQYKVQ